ncbi:MAG TPA: polysaccharide deacetylase family protein, partial [Gemmatimonadaceae bacterium]|nr:polysaccharide deacetylase family protein [Gemmatimonadaceae bacterium]
GRNAERFPGELARIVAEGHELGNHLYTNARSARLSPEAFARDLARTDSTLRRHVAPRWMRPGSGRFTPSMREPIAALGYRGVLGTIYPFDPQIPSRAFMVDVVLSAARPGAIIILHDGRSRGRRTAAALEEILPRLRASGYRVVSVGELEAASRRSPPPRSSRD